MTETERLKAAYDAALRDAYAAFDAELDACDAYNAARLAYSAARDASAAASKAYNAILAAQDKEDKNV